MDLIRSKTAYYPAFHLGSEPRAVECELHILEANGKRYLKTPFAMLNAYADDDIERTIDNRGFYATADDAMVYLASEYPNWQTAAPIMDSLCSARHHYGELVGTGRIADRCGVSTDSLYLLARGHKRFTLKAVRAAVRALADKVSA